MILSYFLIFGCGIMEHAVPKQNGGQWETGFIGILDSTWKPSPIVVSFLGPIHKADQLGPMFN